MVKDSNNAIGRHRIGIVGAADEINPEVAMISPLPGFGPPEASDFSFKFRAFDNVKVDSMEAYTTYGVRSGGGQYYLRDYGDPIRVINDIEAKDCEAITTLNIDTPIYYHTLHVDRITDILGQIRAQYPGFTPGGEDVYDIWIKLVARDSSGNLREREVSYRVNVDQRPEVDIVSPLNGAKIVEQSAMLVNVNSFDDVGVSALKLTATHGGSEVTIYDVTLDTPPFQFLVPMPAFNPDDSSENHVHLRVEALDTYGAAFGDPDNHTAIENIYVDITADQPPTVLIGKPEDGHTSIEGSYLLVQVNAVDDLGIDRAVLNVAGLVGGDRVFTDASYPYEFLVEIPYGQANKDLTLTASATEIRRVGQPRSVTTPTPVVVHVGQDSVAPTIVVVTPAPEGATVVERRPIQFALEVSDNVRVSTVRVDLSADANHDNQFTPDESVSQRLLLEPPYQGSITVGAVEDYTQEDVDQIAMRLTFTALDGAGNLRSEDRPVMLVRNQPPQVDKIQVLDFRGYNMGDTLQEVTEGRGIVVTAIASDPEAGVDGVTFYQAVGEIDDATVYEVVGQDNAAPFQYHLTVPLGRVGQSISFRAVAKDVDGYSSDLSPARTLTILEDQPPTAAIIKPDNDESVIIDGQDIEVWVEALDDLGAEGIDRVVFYVNDVPVQTQYNSYSEVSGSAAQEHIYRAVIHPPQGAQGFVIHAVAFDVMGHSARTQTVRVGRIEDTVAPKLSVLYPMDGEILTTNESIRAVVSVEDIGSEQDRSVGMHFFREAQSETDGTWTVLAEEEVVLSRNDAGISPSSDPDNHYYVYWADFVNGNVLTRTDGRNERLRIVTRVKTPNHTVEKVTHHEIGLPIDEQRFLLPCANCEAAAQTVNYTAIDQYRGADRTGAMMAAWSTYSPMLLEPGLGNPYLLPGYSRTGLFIADDLNESDPDGLGRRFPRQTRSRPPV